MQGLFTTISASPSTLIDHVRAFLTAAALFILALIAGWLLGLIARVILTRIFRRRMEEWSRRLGYKQLEQSLGLQIPLGTIVGWAVQVIVTVLALLLIASLYNPAPVNALLVQSVVYLPTVLIALTIVLVGLLVSHILAGLAFTAARGAKRKDALALSTAVRLGIVLLAVAAALLQLGVATVFITIILIALFATASLASGLAIGLGGADYVRDLLASRVVRAQLRPGQRVAIDDVTGVVVECGPSATTIATDDGRRALIPNRQIAHKHILLG